jgi:hypothetical protein
MRSRPAHIIGCVDDGCTSSYEFQDDLKVAVTRSQHQRTGSVLILLGRHCWLQA